MLHVERESDEQNLMEMKTLIFLTIDYTSTIRNSF